jgi:hypothetical protein
MYVVPRHAVEDVACSLLPFAGRDVLVAFGAYASTDLGALALVFFCGAFLWKYGRADEC